MKKKQYNPDQDFNYTEKRFNMTYDPDYKIKELFSKLDSYSDENNVNDPDYSKKYWGIKADLVSEISKKYGYGYTPETLLVIKIPAAIYSLIVEMERQKLDL